MSRKRRREASYSESSERDLKASTPSECTTHRDQSTRDSRSASPSRSRTSMSTATDLVTERVQLGKFKIYLDRQKQMPSSLEQLLSRVKKTRDGPTSPKSKAIVRVARTIQNAGERDTSARLENFIGYRGQDDIDENSKEGEKGIHRTRDPQFYFDVASAAAAAPANIVLSKFHPDLVYGYTPDVFSQLEYALLPFEISFHSDRPLFYFQMVEWTALATQGSPFKAENKALRDGAAALVLMEEFYKRYGDVDISPEKTVVFGVCVDSKTAYVRMHWRNYGDGLDPGVASIEADIIGRGFLDDEAQMFYVRSILLNVLEWAVGDRLDSIKQSLQKGHAHLDEKRHNEQQGSPAAEK